MLYLYKSLQKILYIATRKAIEKKQKEPGKISGIINFHCMLRTLKPEAKNQTEAYVQIFSDSLKNICQFHHALDNLINHSNFQIFEKYAFYFKGGCPGR
ncbi:MAG: hypothetical protein PHP23_11530 [Desulfobacterales bacterium]|nr:hypothetical protein [Desulfobacterales bacterium]